MVEAGKNLKVTFSRGSVCLIPVWVIIKYYSKHVVRQVTNEPPDIALIIAAEHFRDNDDELISFASGAMDWWDVLFHAQFLEKHPGENKAHEWHNCKKEIMESANA